MAICPFAMFICLNMAFAAPKKLPKIYKSRTHKVVRPEELRGSNKQRIAQNIKAIALGIDQIATNEELLAMITSGVLVEVKDSAYYSVHRGAVPLKKIRKNKKRIICPPRENKVFVRPWVKEYLDEYFSVIARDFMNEFGKKFKLTSGARSLEEQAAMRTKGSCYYTAYAAWVNDPLEESLHGRGIAVDISRRVSTVTRGKLKEMAMSRLEIEWMRKRLMGEKFVRAEFEVEPIEENICYHIVVFPNKIPAI